MQTHITVIEDDPAITTFLNNLLGESGFLVSTANQGIEGLHQIEANPPDLVILDLNLPDMQGEGVCTEIRKLYPELPVIMLTAKDSVGAKVEGLNSGADDYLTKPFNPDELVARIKARLRLRHQDNKSLQVGDLVLDPKAVEVTREGKAIALTPLEFKLLEYLMQHAGTVLSRDMILNRVWAYSWDVESRVVDVYMGYLRKKVDKPFKHPLIQSVRGFGYTIKSTESTATHKVQRISSTS